ncbi:MAG: BBP7 family outer membrane beta-barrel protein [Planctomycetes bacterium]|nr:BBP7 family outer membrane beta-barrel protein [Planctomycetota bacterium]
MRTLARRNVLGSLAGLFFLTSIGQAQTMLPPRAVLGDPVVATEVIAAGDLAATAPVTARFTGSAELLVWWTRSQSVAVPLVTTGVFGQPDTAVVLGNHTLNLGEQEGGRFQLGYWPSENWGFEAGYFFLGGQSTSRSVSSSGSAVSQPLFIPFIDVTLPGEAVTSLAQPGAFSGLATVSLKSFLQGTEANVAFRVESGPRWSLDLLAGFRYVRLSETLTFDTTSPSVLHFPPDVFRTHDSFAASNDFYGGQIGVRFAANRGPWTLDAAAKVAFGSTQEVVSINGQLLTNDFGPLQTFPGGYFAQPTNIGRHFAQTFCVVPEFTFNLGYRFGSHLRGFVGYNFLYLSDVTRPGNQIDRVINPTQNPAFFGQMGGLVGAARPAFFANQSDFWAQGFQFGLMFSF